MLKIRKGAPHDRISTIMFTFFVCVHTMFSLFGRFVINILGSNYPMTFLTQKLYYLTLDMIAAILGYKRYSSNWMYQANMIKSIDMIILHRNILIET